MEVLTGSFFVLRKGVNREMAKAGNKDLLYGIANRLMESRIKAEFTQEEVAEKADLAPNSVHRYEVAERGMSFETAIRLSAAVGVTPNDLVPEDQMETGKTNSVQGRKEQIRNAIAEEMEDLSEEELMMALRQIRGIRLTRMMAV